MKDFKENVYLHVFQMVALSALIVLVLVFQFDLPYWLRCTEVLLLTAGLITQTISLKLLLDSHELKTEANLLKESEENFKTFLAFLNESKE
jgi:predicted neutral ceramidase superfamily lipid hydrolase